jgi:type II restriction/modification system DNA methylase subunit YeeA
MGRELANQYDIAVARKMVQAARASSPLTGRSGGSQFPEGLTPDIPAAQYANDPRAQTIAAAAKRLNELRENWLNPPDLVIRVPEVVPRYPDRLVPAGEAAAKELKKRTLTNLYNQRPAWLDHAHKALDAAVAAAYGWPADLSDDDILERLFKLNQERAKKKM